MSLEAPHVMGPGGYMTCPFHCAHTSDMPLKMCEFINRNQVPKHWQLPPFLEVHLFKVFCFISIELFVGHKRVALSRGFAKR